MSEIMSPRRLLLPEARARALVFGWYPISRITRRTFSAVSGVTLSLWFMVRETVAVETFARLATSAIFMGSEFAPATALYEDTSVPMIQSSPVRHVRDYIPSLRGFRQASCAATLFSRATEVARPVVDTVAFVWTARWSGQRVAQGCTWGH